MDLIRRQDAIDAVKRICWNCSNTICHDLIGEVSALQALPPAQQWIPCSERLPEVSEAYIVSGKQKYEFETEWSYFVDVAVLDPTGEGYIGPWQTFVDWKEGQETYITAWMKLPEPYKGEENED